MKATHSPGADTYYSHAAFSTVALYDVEETIEEALARMEGEEIEFVDDNDDRLVLAL